jgi:hypothetical protein
MTLTVLQPGNAEREVEMKNRIKKWNTNRSRQMKAQLNFIQYKSDGRNIVKSSKKKTHMMGNFFRVVGTLRGQPALS